MLAILASEHHTTVDAKLTEFAKQVQRKEPALTGFKLDHSSATPSSSGRQRSSPLRRRGRRGDRQQGAEREGRITLTIKPPKLKQITYACVCDKYFSIATEHFEGKGKDRAQLFIAIQASPCGPPKK